MTNLASRRPEHDLLVLAARNNPQPEHLARIDEIVRTGVDWEYLCQTASLHGVSPLLYRNLIATVESCTTPVPPETARQLLDG